MILAVGGTVASCGELKREFLVETYWLMPWYGWRPTYRQWREGYELPAKWMMCQGAWMNIGQRVTDKCIPVYDEFGRPLANTLCKDLVFRFCEEVYAEP